MDSKKTIFVIGAGKGCGNHVAKKFGENGFCVVLMARSAENLARYEAEFREAGIETHCLTLDAARPETMTAAINEAKERFGTPNVLFYNVGVTTADAELSGEKDASLLIERFSVDVAAAWHAISLVRGEEFSRKGGTVLVTGGGLALHPMYAYFPLSIDKAALRAMCKALHDELAGENVHVATLTVTGEIAEGRPCDPKILAEDFWRLYSERKDWEFVR